MRVAVGNPTQSLKTNPSEERSEREQSECLKERGYRKMIKNTLKIGKSSAMQEMEDF